MSEQIVNGLAFIRSEAERTKGNGPLGEMWTECLKHAEQRAVNLALEESTRATKHLRDRELESERVDAETMNFRMREPVRETPADLRPLEALVKEWEELAEANRRAMAGDDASRYYGNGLAWAFARCAEDLKKRIGGKAHG